AVACADPLRPDTPPPPLHGALPICHDIGLVVLAGFLSVLGPSVVAAYPRRILNVHPALIPAFCGPGMYGLRPHQAALTRGCKVRSEEHTSELQSRFDLVCRLLLEKK